MRTSSSGVLAGTFLLLGSTLAVTWLVERRSGAPLTRPLNSIPAEIAGWNRMADVSIDARTLQKLQPTSYLARTYAKAGRTLDLFVVFYAQQRAGESMHSPEHCLPGAGWRIARRGRQMLAAGAGKAAVNRYGIERGGERATVFYWYQSKRRVVASEFAGKALLIWDALTCGRTEGAMVRVTVPDAPQADQEASAFAEQAMNEMQRCL